MEFQIVTILFAGIFMNSVVAIFRSDETERRRKIVCKQKNQLDSPIKWIYLGYDDRGIYRTGPYEGYLSQKQEINDRAQTRLL